MSTPEWHVKYIGECNLCDQRVYLNAADQEVRKQGGGRPPETPHRHKSPYQIRPRSSEMPEQDNDRGWMDYARGIGAM